MATPALGICRILRVIKPSLNPAGCTARWGPGPTSRQFSSHVRLCNQLYFTKKHEWVKVSDDIGTVGISNYAQEALGDVVYVQLPEVDDRVEKDAECGALESVKAASELYSPVTGVVLEKNESVEAAPSLINSSAQQDGWLFKVKLSKREQVDSLMDEDSYAQYLKTQEEESH